MKDRTNPKHTAKPRKKVVKLPKNFGETKLTLLQIFANWVALHPTAIRFDVTGSKSALVIRAIDSTLFAYKYDDKPSKLK